MSELKEDQIRVLSHRPNVRQGNPMRQIRLAQINHGFLIEDISEVYPHPKAYAFESVENVCAWIKEEFQK